jgi:hypothetical protein
VATPDKYHPPLLLDFNLALGCYHVSLTPHLSYPQCDCLLLCNVLRHPDWSCGLNENSVDSAVNTLPAIVQLAIPYIKSKNSTFPCWFSNSLKYYIKKKINSSEDIRNQNLVTNSAFPYYRKLVETTVKTHGLR